MYYKYYLKLLILYYATLDVNNQEVKLNEDKAIESRFDKCFGTICIYEGIEAYYPLK